MTYYRLVYKDGSHGAWSTNLEWLKDCAKVLNAEIEERA